MSMSDYLRKGFLLGLGAAISGKEKLNEKLDELVNRNELTREEAKSVMKNFVEKGELKTEEWDLKQKEQRKKAAEEIGLATKEDIQELRARLTVLEDRLEEKSND
jgi:polyhydroxyalkanoate synthesis regulator phasin